MILKGKLPVIVFSPVIGSSVKKLKSNVRVLSLLQKLSIFIDESFDILEAIFCFNFVSYKYIKFMNKSIVIKSIQVWCLFIKNNSLVGQ